MQAFELSKAVGQWKLLHAKEVSYFKTMAQQWNDAVRQNLSEEEKTRFELNAERKVQKVMQSLELAEKARERDRPLFHTNKGFMCHVTVCKALCFSTSSSQAALKAGHDLIFTADSSAFSHPSSPL